MNPVLEAIKNRRSTRAYEQKPVPREIINQLIEAGNQAPYTSMTTSQPWRFVVVQTPEFKQKLLQTAMPFWKQSIDPLKQASPELYKIAMSLYNALDEPKDVIYYQAPVILFVIGPENNQVSCALACENIMVAAQSLGLGSCYVGFGGLVKGNSAVAVALELKDDEAIYGPILLGYPRENSSPPVAAALKTIAPNKKSPQTKWV